MEGYKHAILSSNITFEEWNSNKSKFECIEESPNQIVILCKDKWDNLGVEMDFQKNDRAQSEWTLTVVLILITFQLLIILGLVGYILRNYKRNMTEINGVPFSAVDECEKDEILSGNASSCPILKPKQVISRMNSKDS